MSLNWYLGKDFLAKESAFRRYFERRTHGPLHGFR